MFSHLQAAAADPILGLMATYRDDPRDFKIDLGVGVYRDEAGATPIMRAVKKAEAARLAEDITKTYLGMAGDPQFNARIDALTLGDHPARRDGRVFTAHTPGGTGALRVAADLLHRARPEATVWMSDPTWGNHPSVFKAAGMKIADYPYYDGKAQALRADAMMDALAKVPAGDVVLLHASCHNPSGVDIPAELWPKIADLAEKQGFMPLVDMAYQGFADGLDIDATGPRLLAERVPEMLLCSSCSKNFALYRERIGAISLIGENAQSTQTASSVMLAVIRNIYSMPPAHGAAIVARILGEDGLRTEWLTELEHMRNRINGIRQQASAQLAAAGVNGDFSFIARQRGMFSFLGITPEQVTRLREDHAVYLVASSRVNIAGLNEDNLPRFVSAMKAVLG